jgi:hypothetical protein
MQFIANEQDARNLTGRNFYHRVRYPEDYYTDELFINKFERDGDGQYLQYKFMQAYPISINSMPISYESSDLLKCTVSFTYTRYLTTRIKNIAPTVSGSTQNPDGSWNVDLFYNDRVETKTVSNDEYNRKYKPR